MTVPPANQEGACFPIPSQLLICQTGRSGGCQGEGQVKMIMQLLPRVPALPLATGKTDKLAQFSRESRHWGRASQCCALVLCLPDLGTLDCVAKGGGTPSHTLSRMFVTDTNQRACYGLEGKIQRLSNVKRKCHRNVRFVSSLLGATGAGRTSGELAACVIFPLPSEDSGEGLEEHNLLTPPWIHSGGWPGPSWCTVLPAAPGALEPTPRPTASGFIKWDQNWS